MAGQIHNMIQKIVADKSKGNQVIASSVKTKIILKGIAIDKYTPTSPDDPVIINKLWEIGREFGVFI